ELLGRRPFDRQLPSLMSGYAELGYDVRPRTRLGGLVLTVDEDYLGAITAGGVWAEHQFSPQGPITRFAFERRKPRDQAGWYTARLLTRVPFGQESDRHLTREHDFAQKQRAGEAQSRIGFDVRTRYSLPRVANRTPRLTLRAGAMYARDTQPYSALFGDTRNYRKRLHANANLTVNLNRNWRVAFDVLAARQQIGRASCRERA